MVKGPETDVLQSDVYEISEFFSLQRKGEGKKVDLRFYSLHHQSASSLRGHTGRLEFLDTASAPELSTNCSAALSLLTLPLWVGWAKLGAGVSCASLASNKRGEARRRRERTTSSASWIIWLMRQSCGSPSPWRPFPAGLSSSWTLHHVS